MDYKRSCSVLVKGLHLSPAKIRPLADHIRNKNCVQAGAILKAFPQKGAYFLSKALKSAVYNAMAAENCSENDLYVKIVKIDAAPTRMRIQPRGRGNADRQIRRYSHIFIVLDKGVK